MAPTTPHRKRPIRRKNLVVLSLLFLCLGAISPAQATAKPPSWTWPLSPQFSPQPVVIRGFEPPQQAWLAGHRGIDLAAVEGTKILAPADGVISFAAWLVDREVITIDHGNGLRSSFEPAKSLLAVGSAVKRGQLIGQLKGLGHCRPLSCLHWGVRREESYLNPLLFLGDRRPSILLPIDQALAATTAGLVQQLIPN